jgi:hypothetical protein
MSNEPSMIELDGIQVGVSEQNGDLTINGVVFPRSIVDNLSQFTDEAGKAGQPGYRYWLLVGDDKRIVINKAPITEGK